MAAPRFDIQELININVKLQRRARNWSIIQFHSKTFEIIQN